MMRKLKQLKAYFTGENSTAVIVLIGLAGMLLILLSGLLPSRAEDKAQQAEENSTAQTLPQEPETYRTDLEVRLTELLSGMEGVGEVSVMITVSGSAEQVFAEEVRRAESEKSRQQESAYVITKANGNEEALVSEVKYPAIQGVAVLCSGGNHAAVRERVAAAVATVLGIPQSKIYVGTSAQT